MPLSSVFLSVAMVALPVAAGVLAGLAFCLPDAWWLAWIALVPMAWAVHVRHARFELYLGTFYGGVAFHALSLDWMRTIVEGLLVNAWVVVAHVLAVFWVAGLGIGRRFARRTGWPMAVALPVIWVAMEFARRHLTAVLDGSGLPLCQLGATQIECRHLVQVADLGGVYAVTWLVAAFNGALFDVLRQLVSRSAKAEWIRGLAVAVLAGVLPVGLAWGYGAWRLSQPAGEPGPVVALVPGRFLCSDLPERQALALRKRVEELLSASAAEGGAASFPALFVWHEMAYPAAVTAPSGAAHAGAMPAQGSQPQSRDSEPLGHLEGFCRALGAPIVMGTLRIDPADPRGPPFNTLVYVTPQGGYEGHCDKGHLVPVMETMPRWLETIGAIPRAFAAAPGEGPLGQFRPGNGARLFTLKSSGGGPDYRFAAMVCYDVCFPEVQRELMRAGGDGRAPDFVVVPMYEGFDVDRRIATETLTHSRFRAIESRRAQVRVSEGGYTAMIDGSGEVLRAVCGPSREQSILSARVPVDHRRTLYVLWGDWLPAGAWIVLAVSVFARGRGRGQ